MNVVWAGRNKEVVGWRTPPGTLTLGDDDVHVWRVRLSQNASRLQSLLRTLAADEQARAERFYFHRDRERFIAARGVLRAILSRYLNLEPSYLRFGYSPYGKPALARDSGGDGLRFNVSHSDELAYIKARGEGLSLPLDQFDVSLVPGEPAVLLTTQGDPKEASRWCLRELVPGAGYVAALAVEGHDWQLQCWQWAE